VILIRKQIGSNLKELRGTFIDFDLPWILKKALKTLLLSTFVPLGHPIDPLTLNQRVEGSNPSAPTREIQGFWGVYEARKIL